MNCHACQYALPPHANFCAQCGVRQLRESEPARSLPEASPETAGDRREVTVLFADVSGFTAMSEKLDPQAVTEIVNRFFEVLTEPIYRFGGVVDKYIGDAIMALFGAPIAHEDDPERAVRAAFEMQRAACEFAEQLQADTGIVLKVRIGIHTGLVVTGAVGGAQKRDYTVMGETVNLAQQMEGAARPGKVLVTHETYRHSSHAMDFAALEPVQVKGRPDPVPVYELIGPKAEAPARVEPVSMVGRQAELATLEEAFARAAEGAPHLVMLSGEAGIGKSLLSSALVAGLDPTREVDAQRVRAMSYEHGTPYALLSDFIRRWLGIKKQETPNEIRARLRQRVEAFESAAEARKRSILAISYLLGIGAESAEFTQLTPQQRRTMAFKAFNSLLLGYARDRVMLLNFEDLHWADEASLEWLQSLFDALTTRDFQQSRLLVLCQARPVEGSPLNRWRATIETRTLVLRPLSEAESWSLVASLLAMPNEPERWPEELRKLGEQVLARGEGNPLFLRELVRSLEDAGVLVRDERYIWQVSGSAASQLPSTVSGVIRSRLDRLGPAMRSVLQLASVVGRNFEPALIAQLAEQQADSLPLEALEAAEFLHRRSSGEWQFYQALTHEAVYNSLLLAKRKELHRKVGQALEQQLGARCEESPEVLARHFLLGEVIPKAVYYLFRSGEKALRGFSNQEALHCFEQCLTLMEREKELLETPSRAEVLLALSELLATTGQYAQAIAHLSTVLAEQTHPQERAETMRRLGGIYNLQGQYGEAMTYYEQGLSALATADDPLVRARILLDQALSLFRQGQYEEVVGLCQGSLEALSGTEHPKETAMALSILGIVCYRQNQLPVAEAYHMQAAELREQIQDVFGVASSLNNLGALYLELGDWGRCAENYERSLRLYEQIGDVSRQIIQMNNLGDLLRNRGDLAQALDFHRQALDRSQEIQDSFGAGVAAVGMGLVLVADERAEDAIERLLEGIGVMRGINAVEVLPEALAALAKAYHRCARPIEAREALEQGLAQAKENTSDTQHGLTLTAAALIHVESGELEEAQATIQAALAALGEAGAPIELARATAVEARILSALGDRAGADRKREEAAVVFDRLGAKLDREALATL
ncbi:tetratricopeptide repeat protein [bacterium]|nr:tetratricopeptide repeat protein [bacterium]